MDPATTIAAGSRLLDQGVLGIVIIGLVAAVVFLTMQLLKSFGERIRATEEQTKALQAAEQTADVLRKGTEEASRSRSDLAAFMQEQIRAINSLEKTIEGAIIRRTEQHEDMRRFITDQAESVKRLIQEVGPRRAPQ